MNIVYGTDLLGPMHAHQLDEFTLRAEVQPNADLIRSATTTAACLLGMTGQIGTLAEGAHADLLVGEGNPLEDLTALTNPTKNLKHVIKAAKTI
ncbi:amidohydrolase family protein [Saccharopolyspora shandongensis]|uniref:amidohydrolase family protein n=1 Tax=Saccharopolyspora shandongensis TaxID=418495 RepID=UPI0033EC5901